MTGLRVALQTKTANPPSARLRKVEPVHLRRAIEALPDGREADLSEFALEKVQKRIVSAANDSQLERLTRRDLREGARGFLSNPLPFGRETATRSPFLVEVARRGQRSAILALLGVYLGQFRLGDEAIVFLSSWCAEHSAFWRFRDAEVWRERQKVWHIFEPDIGPKMLANSLLAGALRQEVLTAVGLDRNRVFGGYGEAAFAIACRSLEQAPPQELQALQQRLIEWGHREDHFAYDGVWQAYAVALVEPWEARGRGHTISEDHKRTILNELIAYAGDPRTGDRMKWGALDGTLAKQIVLRWLTRASVQQFLDIVDKTADRRMWAYRRAFWTSYLVADHIDAAWVAFGDNGARLAADAAKRSGDETLAQYGRVQSSTGRTPDHAALIMQIGDLTIADWSHNGKYNIWRKADRGAPKLFRSRYTGYELSSGPVSGSHTSPESMSWQNRVAAEIRKYTNRRVSSEAWMPQKRR